MQEESPIDFSLKHGSPISSTTPPDLSPSLYGHPNHPFYHHPAMLDEAHKHIFDHLSPFALLSSSGGIAISGLSAAAAAHLPPVGIMANQLLPTTSLALTALHRRRRRIGSDCGAEFASVAKKLRSIPDERKDDAYWERRRKNNEAAKRSRDARKAKEDEIAFRAAYLEQENLKLKAQMTMLKSEMTRLQTIIFAQQQ